MRSTPHQPAAWPSLGGVCVMRLFGVRLQVKLFHDGRPGVAQPQPLRASLELQPRGGSWPEEACHEGAGHGGAERSGEPASGLWINSLLAVASAGVCNMHSCERYVAHCVASGQLKPSRS